VVTESLGKGFYGLAVAGTNFAAMLSFLETQGDVQVLSSPRIAALNNQKAVLKVGTDALYVTNVTTNSTTTTTSTTSSPTVTLQPFFSGISLDVTPQIDDAGTVMLHVHPSVTDVTEETKVIDLGNDTTLKLPLATSAINETDSVVRVRDGQIVAIGGLMQQSVTKDHSGMPGLGRLPVVGNLFSFKSSSKSKHELVFLIKPTVIKDDGSGWSSDVPATPLISDAR
jgi:MSHA biogenesis protein MshL